MNTSSMNNMRKIAFIIGSGLVDMIGDMFNTITYHEKGENSQGIVSPYYSCPIGNTEFLFMLRHGKSINKQPEISPATLVKEKVNEGNIWFFHEEKVEGIYAFSAVGWLDEMPLASERSFVVPTSYIRGIQSSGPHSFGHLAKKLHTGGDNPFDYNLRLEFISAIKASEGSVIENGTYIYNGGDCFETKEEITMLDNMTKGIPNRVVGMTTVPEIILANQMQIPYAVLCSPVNPGNGLGGEVSHDVTIDVMDKANPFLIEIIGTLIDYAK